MPVDGVGVACFTPSLLVFLHPLFRGTHQTHKTNTSDLAVGGDAASATNDAGNVVGASTLLGDSIIGASPTDAFLYTPGGTILDIAGIGCTASPIPGRLQSTTSE